MTTAQPIIEAGRDRLGEAECARVARMKLLPYQQAWVDDTSRFRIGEKSRRVGFDYAEAYGCVRDRITGLTDEDYWYSSADESAAVEQAEYCKFFMGMLRVAYRESMGEDMEHDGVKMMTITLPRVSGKAARLNFMTSNPKRYRSKGGHAAMSEVAFHQHASELLKAATPVAAWNGRVTIYSSHNGERSEFNGLLGQARRHADPATYGPPRPTDFKASIHRVTIDDAIAQGLVEKINEMRGSSVTREEFRADLRRSCGSEDRWNEEYLCIPSAQTSSYFPTVLLRDCTSPNAGGIVADLGAFLSTVEERAAALGVTRLTAGCDVGRTNDRFVPFVWGRVGMQRVMLGALVYQGRNFAEMETAINALMGGYFAGKRVARLCIDSTGLGMQLAERMEDKWRGRVEGVRFTAQVKEDIFGRARAAFEEKTALIADSDLLIADFTGIRRTNTLAGHSRYDAEANQHGHADIATAAALGLMADENGPSPMRTVPVLGGLIG